MFFTAQATKNTGEAGAIPAAKVCWLTAETNSRARALYDRVSTRTGMILCEIETS